MCCEKRINNFTPFGDGSAAAHTARAPSFRVYLEINALTSDEEKNGKLNSTAFGVLYHTR